MTYGTTAYGSSNYGVADDSESPDATIGFGSGGFGIGTYGDVNEPTDSESTRGYGIGGFGDGGFGKPDSSGGFIGDDDEDLSGYDTEGFGEGPFGGVSITESKAQSYTLPETAYFGGGQFGEGLYAFENEQMRAIRDAWDSGGIKLHTEANAYHLERAIATPLAFVTDDIAEIDLAHHIHTAIDEELDKIGSLAGVTRQTNEKDPRFRARIMAAFRAAVTGTTHEDVLEFVSTLLETPGSRVDIDWLDSVPGVARISVFEEDLNTASITQEDLAEFATQIVPAGHRIIVELKGTFTFSSTNVDVPPEKGFTDEDFVGGTFSESI